MAARRCGVDSLGGAVAIEPQRYQQRRALSGHEKNKLPGL
jgi:hypothetical protein